MKKIVSLLILMAVPLQAVTLNMQSTPEQLQGTSSLIPEYFEGGFHLRPEGPIDTVPPYRLIRSGGGLEKLPENGGAYLQLAYGNSLVISSVDGAAFDVFSIDLAEYSTVFPGPKIITWRGYYADSTYVDVSFTTDGLIDGTGSGVDFQTFTFPSTFRNLIRLEARSTIFSLDNIVLEKTGTPIVVPDLKIDNAVRLSWKSQTGKLYQVQTSVDLSSWTDYGAAIQGDGEVKAAFDSTESKKKFWRVTIRPQ